MTDTTPRDADVTRGVISASFVPVVWRIGQRVWSTLYGEGRIESVRRAHALGRLLLVRFAHDEGWPSLVWDKDVTPL